MEYYCIMVMTGEEKKFKEAAIKTTKDSFPDIKLFFFERKLRTNQGKIFDAPLFPGYVFLSCEKLTDEILIALRKIDGFCRILKSNVDPTMFQGSSLAELQSFIQKGESWGFSKVEFAEGKPIKVVSGPMMGLEGQIYKINKKKKRITITSSIFPDKKIDLMYEDVRVIN